MRKTASFKLFARRSSKSVRKQCFFTFFETLCTKFAKNAKKQRFLSFSALTFRSKSVRKQCFFLTFFETLCTKFAKNAKKQRFLSFLCDVYQKVWENSVFFHVFRDTLYKVRKNVKKQRFFELFENSVFSRRSSKSVRKSVFSRFSRHFVQSSHKMRKKKTAFFELFERRSAKNARKKFFLVFRDTLCKVSNEMQKQRFLSFLHDVPQKVWENSVFSRFSRHFVQSSHVKCEKAAFFELFARCSGKSVSKQCFFTFFETLCTKFAKNAKKQRFLSFLRDVSQKVWENSAFFFFHVFRDTLYKVRKKCEKTAFFELLR